MTKYGVEVVVIWWVMYQYKRAYKELESVGDILRRGA